jgi:[ribosomal protein S18]-alanine N-acetyltransferase
LTVAEQGRQRPAEPFLDAPFDRIWNVNRKVTRERRAPTEGDAARRDRGEEETFDMSTKRTEKEQVRVHIRWMIRRDMPEVLQTEQESFEFAWTEEDFLRCLRQRNCIGMVAEQGEKVVGFMIYELHKAKLHILNFAVQPSCRRHGVGAQMVAKLISKLSSHRRTRITLEVRETNLSAQLFFRHEGFKALKVLRSFYEDSGEDAYLLQYRLADDTGDDFEETVNRIAQYEES